MKKNSPQQLAVVRVTNYNNLNIADVLAKLDWQPKPNSTVIIKPNLCAIWPKPGEITHPEIIKSLIKYLKKYNCKTYIGETDNIGPSDKPWDFNNIIKNSGYDQFKNINNVEVIDLENQPQQLVKINGLNISVPKIFFEADYYINIAKLKTHWQSGVTLSLKNQMGIVPQNQRKIFHRIDLEKSIALLAKIIHPDLVLIDAVEGMEGQGPHWGKMKKSNLIIGGYNMVEVDSLASYLIGIDPKMIRHIKLADECGIGKITTDHFKQFDKLKIKFKTGSQDVPIKFFRFSAWQERGHACNACGRALELVKKNIIKKNKHLIFKFVRKLVLEKTDFILGRIDPQNTQLNFSKMGNIYCIGDCTKELAKNKKYLHVPGCPPTNQQIIDYFLGKK